MSVCVCVSVLIEQRHAAMFMNKIRFQNNMGLEGNMPGSVLNGIQNSKNSPIMGTMSTPI